jgi:hypothetical protein
MSKSRATNVDPPIGPSYHIALKLLDGPDRLSPTEPVDRTGETPTLCNSD